MIRSPLFISMIDQRGPDSGLVSCIDIPPAVPNQETVIHLDSILLSGPQQQARQWLATVAPIAIVVTADEEIVNRQCGANCIVNLPDRIHTRTTAPNIGLIRHHQQQKSEAFQKRESGDGVRIDHELGNIRWWKWFTVADDSLIHHAVSIQKDSPISGRQRRDSHFVSTCFKSGCDTSRCQITA